MRFMQSEELVLAAQVMQLDPLMAKVLEYAREQNKRISLIAVTPYGKQFIQSVLTHVGIKGYDFLHVASGINASLAKKLNNNNAI